MNTHSDNDAIAGRARVARCLDIAAIVMLALGIACTSFYVLAQTDRQLAGAAAIDAFQETRRAAMTQSPNQSLWSENRQTGYRDSLFAHVQAPPGVLSIPSIGLTVPIFEGTSELVLNRGVGWIEGTAEPGAAGNLGLAGHRDGYFRGLKDLALGDVIDVQTADGTLHYRISELLIVNPADVFVLEPTEDPSVTLVTCYPFYFVGNAPQRYIVKGVLDATST